MALVAVDASRGAQTAFNRAQDKYRKRLNEHELARMEKLSSIDQLITTAQTVVSGLENEDQSAFQERVSNLAKNLKPFERLVEGVCKLSPGGGDLIWGSVSFILEASRNRKQISKEVLEYFMDMAHQMEYLRTVEATFGNSALVSPSIEAVYIAIINFWVEAIRYYRRKLKRGVFSSMMEFMAASNIATEFSQMKAEIVSQETKLHHMASAQRDAYQESDRVEAQASRRAELTRWIGAPNYEADFRAADLRRYGGTCEWLGRKKEYVNWMERGTGGILVIYGIAGAGKTILSSWLINQARSSSPDHTTLYHYFKETDDSKNTPLACIRSLLEQLYVFLLSSNHASLSTFEGQLKARSHKNHTDFEPLWDILSSVLSSLSNTTQQQSSTSAATIVLDAMDECKESKQLVRSLRRLVHVASNTVRVVVTARRSGDHVSEFERGNPGHCLPTFFKISQDDVQHDIASFTKHKVFKIPRLYDPEHEDLRNKIVAAFSDARYHQGMFLWAHLMCKELKYPQSIQDTWDLLSNMPLGLAATYERICKRLLQSSPRSLNFGRLVLQWVFTSNRPMRFVEIKEALKMMQASWSRNMQLVNRNNELIWSREDLVKSCGDLVRYGGAGDEDTIAPVHLSARQFFSTPSSELVQLYPGISLDILGPFLVDISRTEIVIATTCLHYLNATRSHSELYLRPAIVDGTGIIHRSSLPLDSNRTSNQQSFKIRFPMLDYSVMYWADYTLNRLESGERLDDEELGSLLAAITEFSRSPVSVIWLEELIRLTYLELAQNTIRRFLTFDQTTIPLDVLQWLNLVMKALLDFSQILSKLPAMVGFCMSQVRVAVSDTVQVVNEGNYPLESIERGWIHYDPVTDSVFSFDKYSAAPKLRCQVMKTGLRRRPLSAVSQTRLEVSFMFESAAISPCSQFIAALYKDFANHIWYFTCWDVSNSITPSAYEDWAKAILIRNMGESSISYINAVKFGSDNTLITPGGIFSLATQNCIMKPSNIYEQDASGNDTVICFSSHGERVAKMTCTDDYSILEMVKINGEFLWTHTIIGQPSIWAFNETGTRLVIGSSQPTYRLYCLVVDERREIEMIMPASEWYMTARAEARFTADNELFVAVIASQGQWSIGAWSFSQGDLVTMVLIYTSSNRFTFCLVPSALESSQIDAYIVEIKGGSITRRPIDLQGPQVPEWNSSGRLKAWDAAVIENSSDLRLATWSLLAVDSGNMICVKTWSLEGTRFNLLSQLEAQMPGEIEQHRPFALSPQGDCFILGRHSIKIQMSESGEFLGFVAHDLGLPSDALFATFSKDGSHLAFKTYGGKKSTLWMFELVQGQQITRRASYDFEETVYGALLFSYHNRALLCCGPYIMKFEDRSLEVHAKIDAAHTISTDGRFFSSASLGQSSKPHPIYNDSGLLRQLTPNAITPPALLELGGDYVFPPHTLRLQYSQRLKLIYLDHEFVGENDAVYRSRPICILPDVLEPIPHFFRLVWPENGMDNLKLILVSDRIPMVLETPIKKDELMDNGQWFAGMHNL